MFRVENMTFGKGGILLEARVECEIKGCINK